MAQEQLVTCVIHQHPSCAKRSMPTGPVTAKQVPTFRVWQARQLVRRDLAFGVFFFLVSLIYFYKTLPELCSVWAHCSLQHQQSQNAQCSDQWTLLWRSVCGPTSLESTKPSQSTDEAGAAARHDYLAITQVVSAATAVIKLPMAVLLLLGQGTSTYLAAGLLSRDPLHLLFPSLCIVPLLLLLLPLPYPNVAGMWQAAAGPSSISGSRNRRWVLWYGPDHYWQCPILRISVVLCQRLLQYMAAASCVSLSGCQYLQYSQGLRFWRFLGKYAYQGWVAYMLVLPFPLQLVISCLEWCISYSTTIRLAALAAAGSSSSSSSDAFTSFLQRHQLPVSILLAVVLPSLGVMRVEKEQKRKYQQLQQSIQNTAAATTAKAAGAASDDSSSCKGRYELVEPCQEQQPLQQIAAVNRCDSVADLQPGLASETRRLDHSGDGNSSGSRSGSHSSSSRKSLRRHRSAAVAAAAGGTLEDTCFDASVSGVTTGLITADDRSRSSDLQGVRCAAATKSSSRGGGSSRQQFLDDIRSSLQLAANHTATPYTREAAMPDQAHGNDLSGLALPVSSLLASEAEEVFAAAAAATATESHSGGLTRYKSMAECMPVSIKVHTNHSQVSSLGPLLGSALAAQLSPHHTDTAPLQIMTAAFPGCVQLLANVIGLKDQLPHSSGSTVLAGSLMNAAQGCVDGLQRESSSSLITSQQQPEVDVAVGGSSGSTCQKVTCSSSSSAGSMSVVLEHCDPVCLVAAQDQEVRLSLMLSGPQQQQPGCQDDDSGCQDKRQGTCDGRLLVFTDDGVLADEDVDLACSSIRVSLPGQPSGVIHLALLSGKKPATSSSSSAAAATGFATQDQQQDISSTMTTPPTLLLLLLPLVVLPESAAAELQQYVRKLAVGHTGVQAWETVAAFSVDVAYVLAACRSAAAAAALQQNNGKRVQAQQQQLSAGVKAVLKSVLAYTAANGMFGLLQFLMKTVTAVFAATSTETAEGTLKSSRAGDQDLNTTFSSQLLQQTSSSNDCSSTLVGTGTGPESSANPSSAPAKHLAESVVKDASSASEMFTHSPDHDSNNNHINGTPVSAPELLWGFRDPSLEARYQAAAFSSSGQLDFISFIFMAGLGVGCYSTKGPRPAAAAAPLSNDLLISQLAAMIAIMSGPSAALVLRLVVENRLRRLARHQHEARAKKAASKVDSTACSSSSSRCITASLPQQETFAGLDPVTAELAEAAKLKQVLLAVGMCLLPVWAVAIAVPGLLVTPGWVSKVMGNRGLSQELGVLLSTAMKGSLDQVPFSWFWKILTAHGLVNALTGIRHGLRPCWWAVVRYLPALLLALLVAARQQVQGRRHFCRVHGLQVT